MPVAVICKVNFSDAASRDQRHTGRARLGVSKQAVFSNPSNVYLGPIAFLAGLDDSVHLCVDILPFMGRLWMRFGLVPAYGQDIPARGHNGSKPMEPMLSLDRDLFSLPLRGAQSDPFVSFKRLPKANLDGLLVKIVIHLNIGPDNVLEAKPYQKVAGCHVCGLF